MFWVGIVLAGLIALIPWATDLRGKWKHIVLGLEIVALAVAISGHVFGVRALMPWHLSPALRTALNKQVSTVTPFPVAVRYIGSVQNSEVYGEDLAEAFQMHNWPITFGQEAALRPDLVGLCVGISPHAYDTFRATKKLSGYPYRMTQILEASHIPYNFISLAYLKSDDDFQLVADSKPD